MKKENINRATEIGQKLHELDCFLGSLNACYEGKFIIERRKYLLQNVPYGAFTRKEIVVPVSVRRKITLLLEEYMEDLEKELEEL